MVYTGADGVDVVHELFPADFTAGFYGDQR